MASNARLGAVHRMNKNGNGQNCWDLNPNCQAKKCSESQMIHCPAREAKKVCWQVDWKIEMQDLPEQEKKFWQGFYCVGCKDCPVYEVYREEVEDMIDEIEKA